MKHRAGTTTTGANGVAAATKDAPAMRPDQQVAEASPAALVTFAEELGRLVARRELGNTRNRRGYGLPELLLGASVMAYLWVLVARVLGWLLH